MMQRIILVTFADGDETDREVFGPFDDLDAAWAWADPFQTWFDALPGTRKIAEMANLPIQAPASVETLAAQS